MNGQYATAPSDAALQDMFDEFQLRKLVHGYCRAVDRGDMAQLRGMHHDDAKDDHGAFSVGTVDDLIYSIATHTFSAGDRDVDVTIGGRYLDKYEKRYGTWKFIERRIVTDWANVNDPSYQFFSLLLNEME